jgi:colanic acid/amylovoran biosynthesis glycosyltransferase
MKYVGIYRTTFGHRSEAFLAEQARALVRFSPIVVTRTWVGDRDFPTLCVGDGFGGVWRERLYSLTRWPRLVGTRGALSHLRLLHAHFGPDGSQVLPLARELGIPLIVTFHGFDATLGRRALLATRRPSNLRFVLHERELKREASAFVAVSGFIADCLRARGYPEDKIVVHYIGVDTQKFRPRPRPRSGARFILSVGRHVEMKGVDTLLRAFARIAHKHTDVNLVQVGIGPLTPSLARLTRELGLLGRVQFRGAIGHGQVVDLMQQAELFALPSQTASDGHSEGLGIVFNEASASGLPVVATWHGPIPEAVLDGTTGMLVPERDDRALSERLEILLGDRALGAEMGRRGRELVCERFDLRTQTATLEDLYERLTC